VGNDICVIDLDDCFDSSGKGQSGKPLCTNPPYGYIKDPVDKLHWIIDEKAAEVRYFPTVHGWL
jgi:hypothetical protein